MYEGLAGAYMVRSCLEVKKKKIKERKGLWKQLHCCFYTDYCLFCDCSKRNNF